jgi:hypothetical protein
MAMDGPSTSTYNLLQIENFSLLFSLENYKAIFEPPGEPAAGNYYRKLATLVDLIRADPELDKMWRVYGVHPRLLFNTMVASKDKQTN